MFSLIEKHKFLLYFIGTATTIGSGVPVGFNLGIINSPAPFMRSWCNQTLNDRYNIQLSDTSLDLLWSSIVSAFPVGGAIGSVFGAWIADRFGRKGSLIITSESFTISALLFQFCRYASSVEMLMFGRLFAGLSAGICTSTLPMYLTELAPLALRGTFGAFGVLGLVSGIVIGQVLTLENILGNDLYWHYALSSFVIFVLICYSPAYFFPESPKYLYVVRGDRDAARRALQRLRPNNPQLINDELDQMQEYKSKESGNSTFKSVLKNPKLRLPLIIVISYMGGLQLSGINAIFYYSELIYGKTGMSQSQLAMTNLAAGIINLIVSFMVPILMTKINRRPLMMFSSGAVAILLVLITIMVYFINSASWLPIACIVVIFLYIIFFAIALGPLPYFIGSELFETEPRPVAMAMGSLSSWVCNFIIGITFPTLERNWGAFVFLPYAFVCTLIFLLTKFYVPETRNREISEIAASVSKGFRSRPVGNQ